MNWYVKLFAPLIICFVLAIAFQTAEFTNNDFLIPKAEFLLRIASILIAWGIIQAMFIPNRTHKNRNRILLILCTLIYPLFVFVASSGGNLAEEWTIPLFLGAAVATVAFFLRHRGEKYSLAPKWEEMKYISTAASLGIGTLFTLFLMDEVLIKWIRVMKRIPDDWGIAMLIFWGVTTSTAIVSYYTEAILHYKRSSLSNWESRMEQMGKD